MALSALVCLGRHTVTGLLAAGGKQFDDWSADYRVFSNRRFDCAEMFGVARDRVVELSPDHAPMIVAMDDTIVRKTGPKAHGVAYRRDPLSPPFQANLIRGQRFIQLSAVVPQGTGLCPARTVPIDFRHAPTPPKPRKNASPAQLTEYRRAENENRIAKVGANCVKQLRKVMDEDSNSEDRPLWMVVDGTFTNRGVIKKLPERTTLIGRIRKDAKLCLAPRLQPDTGRKKLYGPDAPTPEQLLRDRSAPWSMVEAFAAGKIHGFKIKVMSDLRWRVAGGDKKLMMIVIAPLAYRPRKGSRLLYRQPAFLICTDDCLPVNEILQAYLWRWEVEVNFRDEKTLLGVGQAQVRNENSVETVPAMIVCSYSFLLLSAIETYGVADAPDLLPKPKWRRKEKPSRASTNSLINMLRYQLWGKSMGFRSLNNFVASDTKDTKCQKQYPNLENALLYAVR